MDSKRIFISLVSFVTNYNKLSRCFFNMRHSNNYQTCVLELEKAYRLMRRTGTYYYNGDCMSVMYDILNKKLRKCEDLLESSYITDISADFIENDKKYFEKKIDYFKTNEEILDFIVWNARNNILVRFRRMFEDDFSLDDIDLTNECLTVSVYVELFCKKVGIACKTIKIPPAFTDRIKLYDGDGFHYFNIIELNGEQYIVDCTYKQFFKTNENLFEMMGVVLRSGVMAGAYMLIDNSRLNTAMELLKKGWIIANDENKKNYFDGFTLSYRNALYYERCDEVNYNVRYTVEDYNRFLNEEDELFNYEPFFCLGVQNEPLNNSKLCFKINR